MYDLVELLERVTKPRTLHPALSLKEIENLQDTRNRPTKFYSKAKVLIIHNDEGIVGNNAEKIGTFLKALNSQTQVTTLSMDRQKEVVNELSWLRQEAQRLIMTPYPYSLHNPFNTYNPYSYERMLVEQNQQRMKENDTKMTQMKEKEEELKKINEKCLIAISTTIDKWVEHANDEGWLTSFIQYFNFDIHLLSFIY